MNSDIKWFEDALDTVQAVILSLLIKIGPFAVALMPAMFTGYAIYTLFSYSTRVAWIFAVITAYALEVTNILAVHTAVHLWNAKTKKFWFMPALVAVCIATSISVIAYSGNTFPPLVHNLGMAGPILTTIVYISIALWKDASTEVKHADTELTAERDLAMERVRLEQQNKHEAELEQMRLKHAERMERIRVKSRASKTSKSNVLDVLDDVNMKRQEAKIKALEAMLSFLENTPTASYQQIADHIGVKSRQTAKNYTDELIEAGRLHKNGAGWEVTR